MTLTDASLITRDKKFTFFPAV